MATPREQTSRPSVFLFEIVKQNQSTCGIRQCAHDSKFPTTKIMKSPFQKSRFFPCALSVVSQEQTQPEPASGSTTKHAKRVIECLSPVMTPAKNAPEGRKSRRKNKSVALAAPGLHQDFRHASASKARK
jgi:hypothetical protein